MTCSKTKYCIIMFRIIFNIFIRFKWQKLFFNILSLETCVTNCLGRQVFSIFRICSILRDWASTSQDLMHGVYELRLKSLCYRTSVTPYYMAINAYTCFTLNIKVPIMLGNLFVNVHIKYKLLGKYEKQTINSNLLYSTRTFLTLRIFL